MKTNTTVKIEPTNSMNVRLMFITETNVKNVLINTGWMSTINVNQILLEQEIVWFSKLETNV